MKAKTFYIHPSAPAGINKPEEKGEPYCMQLWSRKDYPYMGVNVPFKVIKGADVEKLVERAARATYHAHEGVPWSGLPSVHREIYREQVRAVFKSIGLL